MKTKEEILAIHYPIEIAKTDGTLLDILNAMQEYTDQQTANLKLINEKQGELIEANEKLILMFEKFIDWDNWAPSATERQDYNSLRTEIGWLKNDELESLNKSLQSRKNKEERTIPFSGKTKCAQCGEIGGNEATHDCHKNFIFSKCGRCGNIIREGHEGKHIDCKIEDFEPKSIFTRRRIRNAKTYDFVVKHKVLIYNTTAYCGNYTKGKNDFQLQELIALARKEIGYSDKTWSGDIFISLVNLYKKICV